MDKCHKMYLTCAQIQLKLLEEELERQEEAQHPFYLEENQAEYERRWREAQLDYELDRALTEHPNWQQSLTGDAALDDDEDYCSDMEDCLIPAASELLAEEEELYPTDVVSEESDSDDDPDFSRIDFTEEINLNDLYC